MGQAGNTVGLDTTSAAIARGEVGANYSRYSTGNLAALAAAAGIGGSAANGGAPIAANSGNNRMSQSFGNGGGHGHRSSMAGSIGGSAGGLHTPFAEDGIQVEMDNLPQTMYAGNTTGLSSPGFPLNNQNTMGGRSRFSEYGLNDTASSSESPSFRDSAVFESSNRHDSIYNSGKSMEDTSLLWNEKNVEADE